MMNDAFNIVSLFHEAAKKFPDHIAIIHKKKEVTFSRLRQDVIQAADHMRSRGLQPGDRVLVFVPMSIELYTHVLALYHIGCTAVFLDEWINLKRLSLCCRIALCKGFIGIPLARVIGFFLKDIRKIPVHLSSRIQSREADLTGMPLPHKTTTQSETALITFTTGSTGTPKGAKRTHLFLKEQFDALIEKIDPKDDDVDMPALPIVLLINLGCGITSVIPDWKSSKPQKMQPGRIFEQIREHGVNRITSSPYFIRRLAESASTNNIDTSAVRKIFTGGAPVFPSEATILGKGFPDSAIEVVYGSTEAEPISSVNTRDLSALQTNVISRGLYVGHPYHKCKVRVIGWKDEVITCTNEEELAQMSLEPGRVGEIIVSGPHVLREYFNNEEALKRNKIFIGDACWHRTGDSGYLDNGKLFLTGRCNTLFEQDGRLVAPFLYEGFLQQIEGVAIGTIMQVDGRIIWFIELLDQSVKPVVSEALQEVWPKPDEIRFVKIPRDKRHHSKIEYNLLRKEAESAATQ